MCCEKLAGTRKVGRGIAGRWSAVLPQLHCGVAVHLLIAEVLVGLATDMTVYSSRRWTALRVNTGHSAPDEDFGCYRAVPALVQHARERGQRLRVWGQWSAEHPAASPKGRSAPVSSRGIGRSGNGYNTLLKPAGGRA